MSEASMRSNLVKALRPLDAVPIENYLRAGTPDINYIGGWIECKWMKFWPKSADHQPVRFHHPLKKNQGLWLARRASRGGTVLLAAQVGREWFFFDGATIKDHFNKMTRPQMRERALLHMPNGLERKKLIAWLRKISHPESGGSSGGGEEA